MSGARPHTSVGVSWLTKSPVQTQHARRLGNGFRQQPHSTDDAQSVKSDWSGDYCERVALRHCFGLKPNQRLNAREKALVSE